MQEEGEGNVVTSCVSYVGVKILYGRNNKVLNVPRCKFLLIKIYF